MPRSSAPRANDTPRARALGSELRAARQRAGLTTRALAAVLGHPGNSRIVRWETGHTAPTAEDTATVLGVLEVTGDDRTRILQLAREVADPNWLSTGVDRQLGMLIDYEREATAITEVNLVLIPGLLQTPEMARSIFNEAGIPQVEQRVMMRMGRQSVLAGEEPAAFTALIGEYALRYPPTSMPAVAAGQLRRLLYWSSLEHITVQVIPLASRWTPAREGAFVLLEFTNANPVVHLEHYRSTATLTDLADVHDYQTAAERVRRAAMSPEDSARLIAEIAGEMQEIADDPTSLAQGESQ